MKTFNKKILIPILLITVLIFMIALPFIGTAAAQLPVNLGTTSTYAVLGGSTITNTGPTTINGDAGGDLGLYPGSAFTGEAEMTISGAVNINNNAARIAQDDLLIAYNDAAGRTTTTTIAADLGGTTLYPGTYTSASSIQITGTLTLDAQGDPDAVFVFQAGSTLTTATDSNIILLNGARYCRIFWQVGSSATLGVNSHFVGHIFAFTSITATTGATVQGQLLALNGAVTLDTNTITNGICETSSSSSVSSDVSSSVSSEVSSTVSSEVSSSVSSEVSSTVSSEVSSSVSSEVNSIVSSGVNPPTDNSNISILIFMAGLVTIVALISIVIRNKVHK